MSCWIKRKGHCLFNNKGVSFTYWNLFEPPLLDSIDNKEQNRMFFSQRKTFSLITLPSRIIRTFTHKNHFRSWIYNNLISHQGSRYILFSLFFRFYLSPRLSFTHFIELILFLRFPQKKKLRKTL